MSVCPFRSAHQNFWSKTISLLLALVLIFPFFTWAFDGQGYAARPSGGILLPALGKPWFLSGELGSLGRHSQNGRRTVICIQDLHCNAEVQKNISSMLDQLAREHGLRWVGVEGASGPVDAGPLRDFPDRAVRESLAEYLLKQGRISGAEHCAALGEKNIRLVGLEQPELYQASLRKVRNFLSSETQGSLADLRGILEKRKPKIYSAELGRLDKQCLAYREGRLDTLTFAAFLLQAGIRRHLPLEPYPMLRRFTELRQSFFALDIDSEQLFSELERLEGAVRETLYTHAGQRELDQAGLALDLIEKLLNISATQSELRRFRENRAGFTVKSLTNLLQRLVPGEPEEVAPETYALDGLLQQVEEFYQLADARSRVFADEIEKNLDQSGQSLAVAVTGGFHTEKVLARLQARGFSVIEIRPRWTREDVVNPYFELLQDRETPLEKLLAKNQTLFAVPAGGEELRRWEITLGMIVGSVRRVAEPLLKQFQERHPQVRVRSIGAKGGPAVFTIQTDRGGEPAGAVALAGAPEKNPGTVEEVGIDGVQVGIYPSAPEAEAAAQKIIRKNQGVRPILRTLGRWLSNLFHLPLNLVRLVRRSLAGKPVNSVSQPTTQEHTILVVNLGSSSLKFEVFKGERSITSGLMEGVGGAKSKFKSKGRDGEPRETGGAIANARAAVEKMVEYLKSEGLFEEIEAVGHRVAHNGGKYFEPTLITEEVMENPAAKQMAPLHFINYDGMRWLKELFPKAPQVAVFDSIFFKDVPAVKRVIPLPRAMVEELGIRKLGFHGASYTWIVRRLGELVGVEKRDLNAIVFHLGSGTSGGAVREGIGVDTTFGMTANSGLPMSTRTGTIDPGLFDYIYKNWKEFDLSKSLEENLKVMERVLSKESGLLGMSGSKDMRDILEAMRNDAEPEQQARAQMAFDYFVETIVGKFGEFYAGMGKKPEYLVFTAGIGENCPELREAVCRRLEHLGVKLDAKKNEGLRGKEAVISRADSLIQVWVIPTQEERMIAFDTARLVFPEGPVRASGAAAKEVKPRTWRIPQPVLAATAGLALLLVSLIARGETGNISLWEAAQDSLPAFFNVPLCVTGILLGLGGLMALWRFRHSRQHAAAVLLMQLLSHPQQAPAGFERPAQLHSAEDWVRHHLDRIRPGEYRLALEGGEVTILLEEGGLRLVLPGGNKERVRLDQEHHPAFDQVAEAIARVEARRGSDTRRELIHALHASVQQEYHEVVGKLQDLYGKNINSLLQRIPVRFPETGEIAIPPYFVRLGAYHGLIRFGREQTPRALFMLKEAEKLEFLRGLFVPATPNVTIYDLVETVVLDFLVQYKKKTNGKKMTVDLERELRWGYSHLLEALEAFRMNSGPKELGSLLTWMRALNAGLGKIPGAEEQTGQYAKSLARWSKAESRDLKRILPDDALPEKRRSMGAQGASTAALPGGRIQWLRSLALHFFPGATDRYDKHVVLWETLIAFGLAGLGFYFFGIQPPDWTAYALGGFFLAHADSLLRWLPKSLRTPGMDRWIERATPLENLGWAGLIAGLSWTAYRLFLTPALGATPAAAAFVVLAVVFPVVHLWINRVAGWTRKILGQVAVEAEQGNHLLAAMQNPESESRPGVRVPFNEPLIRPFVPESRSALLTLLVRTAALVFVSVLFATQAFPVLAFGNLDTNRAADARQETMLRLFDLQHAKNGGVLRPAEIRYGLAMDNRPAEKSTLSRSLAIRALGGETNPYLSKLAGLALLKRGLRQEWSAGAAGFRIRIQTWIWRAQLRGRALDAYLLDLPAGFLKNPLLPRGGLTQDEYSARLRKSERLNISPLELLWLVPGQSARFHAVLAEFQQGEHMASAPQILARLGAEASPLGAIVRNNPVGKRALLAALQGQFDFLPEGSAVLLPEHRNKTMELTLEETSRQALLGAIRDASTRQPALLALEQKLKEAGEIQGRQSLAWPVATEPEAALYEALLQGECAEAKPRLLGRAFEDDWAVGLQCLGWEATADGYAPYLIQAQGPEKILGQDIKQWRRENEVLLSQVSGEIPNLDFEGADRLLNRLLQRYPSKNFAARFSANPALRIALAGLLAAPGDKNAAKAVGYIWFSIVKTLGDDKSEALEVSQFFFQQLPVSAKLTLALRNPAYRLSGIRKEFQIPAALAASPGKLMQLADWLEISGQYSVLPVDVLEAVKNRQQQLRISFAAQA